MSIFNVINIFVKKFSQTLNLWQFLPEKKIVFSYRLLYDEKEYALYAMKRGARV